ncbi:zinc finger CCCH domain-containing protein 19-like isoform X2 [Phragmites australis]|uniref:zinc finger CCCH domain-containing protein 19-like isoform X2 n=1 Tax=Phragmites australis TaxID=29695 RepID=UPI002D7976E7|nr:zinc finger CCCH domain-containing protein 19-like isoform X2 [Phragmites australis]
MENAAGAELLSPAEADWPPDLRLPPPPPAPAVGMDDSQFLGSIIGEVPPARQGAAEAAPVGAKRKRGRPPKKRDGAAVVAAAAKPARARKEDEDEVVCFICFDGGNLVVCDRRGCPKVYHPACIKRDEAFFQSRSKWNCGWHICSSCEKAVHYMCYTCTYSLCKLCIKQGKFFSVRGTKGFCDTCFVTILLIESKDQGDIKVDFDDINSWEYLFKLYWLDLKGKLSLTLEELTSAKNRWNVPNTSARKEKEESSDDLYDVNNDDDAGSDCSLGRQRRTNSSRKKGRKRQKVNSDCSIAAKKIEPATRDYGSLPTKVPCEGVSLPVNTKWASPELLEFIGHMRDGDQSYISQFDVQTLLLEYIKKNNLRDPQRKSQIVCDARLHRLFRKARVAHFEMLKLLEMHFLTNETSRINDDSQGAVNSSSAQIDTNGYNDMAAKLSPDKRRRMHRKIEREPQVNLEAYAAIDMHNINLIYMRRSLMEDLIDDATFSDKIHGAFVRIKISGVGQKQDMYRLVKVIGTHKVPEKYSTGKKMTNLALEILNLKKEEIITMDTISNQDFTEEECKRLRQSMKYGLISRLKVGDIQEKAKIFQSVRVNDWLENEKQRLGHLRDRASETGRRKELRECVEKLKLLNNSEERTRRINEVPEVHVDSHMDPNYESDEEMDDQKAVGRNVNWTRSDTSISRRKSKYPKAMQNHTLKFSDASRHPKKLSMESTVRGSGAGRAFENSHSTNGTDIPKSSTKVNSTMYEEAGSLSSSGVTMSSDAEPEKVWHYKDPSGNVQGPFTLLQLSKWTSYFPRDLRVWLTFESEERSLLLTEVLSKQQKDFTQAASVTTSSKATSAGTGHNRNSPSVDQTNALSPVGYSMVNSSGMTVQSNKYSIPEKESVNSPDDSLSFSTSSVPPKGAHTWSSQVQYQTKHSALIQSHGSPCGQTGLHHDGVQGGCSGESNHRHSSGALWSPTTAQMSCSGQGNVDSHDNQHASWSQSQHDSKKSSQGGSVKDLNSRLDASKNLPTQRIRRDGPSPAFAWSPSESRTASSQHEGSCLSSTTNPSLLDELHSSMASGKPKSCVPATPVEDRGSSSPSDMLSHSERVPNCSPQSAPSASASDVFKVEEIMNQQRTLEADTSNASVNQSPQSKIFPVSSPDNQDIDREFPSPTPRSENKEPAVDNSRLTPASPSPVSDTCKMEDIVNQQKLLEADASNSSAIHSPQSKVSPVGSPNNEDLEHEYPSSSPWSENEEPAVDNSLLTSAAPENLTITSAFASDTCKMGEIVYQQKDLEADASDASLNQPPQSSIFPVSSPDNQDTECEYPSPTPQSENKEPLVDNSGLKSAAPENLAATSASASDTCKMEILNKKRTLETDASDGFIIQSPKSKVFLVSSPDDLDIEHEFPSPTPRSENKEPAVDNSRLTSAVPENVANVPGNSPDASVSLKSGPATGELSATESDFRGEEEIIQKELYSESTVVTRENMVINGSCVAESIDVSDVLESLIEQRCGTSYMHGTTAVEDLLAASVEEEPQCSSPIALSPWGEPSYYQGDAVDSALWGVQDDSISDMWSLLSPSPTPQPSSGIGAERSDTRDINEVAVAHRNSETFQRGQTPGEENANQAISGVATDQVTSKPNDVSISSVNESTGVLGWQPSADQSLYAGTEWSTGQNFYLSSCEKAASSSKSSWEASRKQECTNSSIYSANRGSHRSHHRDRYSQISESWLLSSNYSRSRSDRFGTGGSSRSTSKGQTRGVCKFHESGHCRKGASCSYLHP